MQSHAEDPGSISATQAFSLWARIKSRVAKPTSSSMKESSNRTVPHYSGNTNQQTNQQTNLLLLQLHSIRDLKQLSNLFFVSDSDGSVMKLYWLNRKDMWQGWHFHHSGATQCNKCEKGQLYVSHTHGNMARCAMKVKMDIEQIVGLDSYT